MVKKSKNINMFLINGQVTGIIKCTLSNWIGLVYKIPRTKLTADEIKNRPELKQNGIYFLLGKSEEEGKNSVYIGQAGKRKNGEGVLLRVLEHTRDNHRDYFNEVIILTTQNNTFGATEISYLENKFTNLAKEINRYLVRNNNEPTIGNVTEEKESELDEVIENTKTIIGMLGHRLFVPVIQPDIEKAVLPEEDSIFYLNRKTKKSSASIRASCKRTEEGFVVLKGSMVECLDSDSIPTAIKEMRHRFLLEGKIDKGILQEDVLLNSPSYAAGFVLGMSTNGRTDWRDAKGVTLKELEEKELEKSK